MQPDYGSTRQRAAERVLGTLLGSLLASGLFFLKLPHAGASGRGGAQCVPLCPLP